MNPFEQIMSLFAPQDGAYGMADQGFAPVMAFAPAGGPPAGIDPATIPPPEGIPMPRPDPRRAVEEPASIMPQMAPPSAPPMMSPGLDMLAGGGQQGPLGLGGLFAKFAGGPENGRRFADALAGGLGSIGGNTAGGTMARAFAGSLGGASKSDRDSLSDRLSVLDRAIKARSSGTDEEYKGALTDYTRARTNNALNGTTPTGRGTVQSPFQKWAEIERRSKDAQRRFQEKYGVGNPLLNQNEAKVRRQKAEDEYNAWRKDAFGRAGLDPVTPPKQEALSGGVARGVQQPSDVPMMEMKGNGTNSEPYEPSTSDDYSEIPSGAYYRHPDGSVRLKK